MKIRYLLKGLLVLLLSLGGHAKTFAQTDTTVAAPQAEVTNSTDSLWSTASYLLSFTGACNNSQAVLNWKTDNRFSLVSFILERGADESLFSPIGEVNVQNGSKTNSFTYVDTKPLTGRSFYRLKMKDADGKITYSSVVSVTCLLISNLKIHYDAASGIVNFAGMEGSNQYQVKVYSSIGQPVLQKTISAAVTSISISNLSHGLYVVHITDGAVSTASQKIIW